MSDLLGQHGVRDLVEQRFIGPFLCSSPYFGSFLAPSIFQNWVYAISMLLTAPAVLPMGFEGKNAVVAVESHWSLPGGTRRWEEGKGALLDFARVCTSSWPWIPHVCRLPPFLHPCMLIGIFSCQIIQTPRSFIPFPSANLWFFILLPKKSESSSSSPHLKVCIFSPSLNKLEKWMFIVYLQTSHGVVFRWESECAEASLCAFPSPMQR